MFPPCSEGGHVVGPDGRCVRCGLYAVFGSPATNPSNRRPEDHKPPTLDEMLNLIRDLEGRKLVDGPIVEAAVFDRESFTLFREHLGVRASNLHPAATSDDEAACRVFGLPVYIYEELSASDRARLYLKAAERRVLWQVKGAAT